MKYINIKSVIATVQDVP